ncbi:Ig-like domain-containing protein [Kurthia senegalensis]|uniref:Ig-like domain-containing protein n=1 Tax=Kurthia senegalensis TaxID=1033740 RepID=UPI0002880348|nr:Ig domain-containing protein [Kurthia senegalensis]
MEAPVVSFKAEKTNVDFGKELDLNALVSKVEDNSGKEYTATVTAIAGVDVEGKAIEVKEFDAAKFVATVAGTYTVTYTVVDDNNNEKEYTTTVVVGAAKTAVTSIVSADETTVVATLPAGTTEEAVAGNQITLTLGEQEITATYVAKSLTEKGEATFKLNGEAKLQDTKAYTASADWAEFANATFVAKVAPAYVAKFTKVTTGIPAAAQASVTVAAENQYGEEIAVPTTAAVKVTVNGLALTANDAKYENGKVTISKQLNEGDKVVITLTHTDGKATPTVLAEDAIEYTVVKEEASKATTLSVNAADTSIPAKEATDLSVKLLDQFNNEMDNKEVIYQVNGQQVDTTNPESVIQVAADGKVTFKSDEAGTYKVEVFSKVDSKVQASTTITVGAATLTTLTATAKNTTGFNNEAATIATIAGNTGSVVLPENIKFNITSATAGVTAADVKVTAETVKDAAGNESIEIKATSSKQGTYTITPYIGASFTDAKVIKANDLTFTTTTNTEVASISDFAFDSKELKAGSTNVKAAIVFKNKHGEVLTAAQVKDNATFASSKAAVTGTPNIEDVTKDGVTTTYVTLPSLTAGTAVVSVQVGNIVKTASVNVVAPVLTKVTAGNDVTGVVAGDAAELAKYNAIETVDQDGKEVAAEKISVNVTDKDGKEVAGLADIVTGNIDAEGKFNEDANGKSFVKVLPTTSVAAGTYKVTVTAEAAGKTVTSNFNVTVGEQRKAAKMTVAPSSSKLGLDGKMTVTINVLDQYGKAFVAEPKVTSTNKVLEAGTVEAVTGKAGEYTVEVTGKDKGTGTLEFTIGDVKASTSITVGLTTDVVSNVAIDGLKNDVILKSETTGAATLTATGIEADGSKVNINQSEVLWTSSDESVATIVDGVIETKEVTEDKKVTFTADVLGKKQTVTVTVSAKSSALAAGTFNFADEKVTSVNVEETKEQKVTFKAFDQYGDEITPKVKALSIDPTIATVTANDAEITVTGKAAGTTSVRVTVGNEVIVVPVTVTAAQAQ